MSLGVMVNVDVENLGQATDFYCNALVLRVGRHLGPTIVELLGAAAPIFLIEAPAGSAASGACPQARYYSRHWTPVHLDFTVSDLDAALARAQRAGAQLEGSVSTAAWGKLARMSDPFGNGFCLVQFLNRGYDEIATTRTGLAN